jgi:SAM-dependent methyltransferase
MTTAETDATGSAGRHGVTWGARPHDWEMNEEAQRPVYAAALDQVGVGKGTRLLEVGCGTGVFLRLAADRGARVVGLDAAAPLLELAASRVPEADLHEGDMQFLPFDDDEFDVVAGFNAFFFAADMVAALREAGRVAKPEGIVVVQVWGRPEACDLTAMKQALHALLPPSDEPEPTPLSTPGVLEGLAAAAGIAPVGAYDVACPMRFADEQTLVRGLLSPGLIVELIPVVGENRLAAAFLDAMRPFRQSDGSYLLHNEWHTLLARA